MWFWQPAPVRVDRVTIKRWKKFILNIKIIALHNSYTRIVLHTNILKPFSNVDVAAFTTFRYARCHALMVTYFSRFYILMYTVCECTWLYLCTKKLDEKTHRRTYTRQWISSQCRGQCRMGSPLFLQRDERHETCIDVCVSVGVFTFDIHIGRYVYSKASGSVIRSCYTLRRESNWGIFSTTCNVAPSLKKKKKKKF